MDGPFPKQMYIQMFEWILNAPERENSHNRELVVKICTNFMINRADHQLHDRVFIYTTEQ